jgi:predicted XRE-type DNA-binding protein
MAQAATESKELTRDNAVTRGSGNVFEDLGLPNPGERLAKAQLVGIVSEILSERRLSQTKAAKIVGVDQPTLSKLLGGSTKGFSLDRLVGMLSALGYDVDINVRPHREVSSPVGRIAVART